MALTSTSRLTLPQWSADSDPAATRQDLNAAFLSLENSAAMSAQGTTGARPAAGKRGRLYFATDTGLVWYDNGSAWSTVNDHGGLIGLGDDDHPQYLTASRHSVIDHSASLDHGALGGLGDDDHPQYLTPARLAAMGVGPGGDHGALSGLADDDHPIYLTNARHDTTARHGASVVDHGSIGGLTDDDHPKYLKKHWGLATRTTAVTSSATSEILDNAGLSITLTVPANRLIMLEFQCRGFSHTDGGLIALGVFEDGLMKAEAHCHVDAPSVPRPHGPLWTEPYQTVAGSHTFTMGFWTPIGGGAGKSAALSATTTAKAKLVVWDGGPAS